VKIVWLAAAAALTTAAAPQTIEFEAASVKPSSGARSPQMRLMVERMMETAEPGTLPISSPGRISVRNEPLMRLMARAWSVRASQISGPRWISEDDFAIEATFPPNTSTEDLHRMLQALLESRFGMKLHREQSTVKGCTLTVAKDGPKLKPASAVQAVSPERPLLPPPPPPPPAGMAPNVRSITAFP
jgi:uncharacterized protein (TIGR03435 family)